MWPLHITWTSLRHDGWFQKAGPLRKEDRTRQKLDFLLCPDLEIVQCHTYHILLVETFRKTYPSSRHIQELPSKWRQGRCDFVGRTCEMAYILVQQSLENTICHKGLLVSLKIVFNLPRELAFRHLFLGGCPSKYLSFSFLDSKRRLSLFLFALTLAIPYKVCGKLQDPWLAKLCVLETVSYCMCIVFRNIFIMN